MEKFEKSFNTIAQAIVRPCSVCIANAANHFPEMPEAERIELLWTFTSFPFGDCAEVEQHLIEFKEKGYVHRHDPA